MTPEERQILIQTHRMVEENNKILRKMHRNAVWGSVFHFLYWVVIIGISVGAYLYVQPFVDQAVSVYTGIKGDINAVKNVTNQLGDVGELINQATQQ